MRDRAHVFFPLRSAALSTADYEHGVLEFQVGGGDVLTLSPVTAEIATRSFRLIEMAWPRALSALGSAEACLGCFGAPGPAAEMQISGSAHELVLSSCVICSASFKGCPRHRQGDGQRTVASSNGAWFTATSRRRIVVRPIGPRNLANTDHGQRKRISAALSAPMLAAPP